MTALLGKSLKNYISNRTDPTSQPTILNLNKSTGPRHKDRNHFSIRSLNSGIDVPRSGRNIDNRTGMKPQGPIVTTIPESNRAKKYNIFNLYNKTSDIA